MTDSNHHIPFMALVTVGERGNIWLPTRLRRLFSIEAGHHLLVFLDESRQALILTTFDQICRRMSDPHDAGTDEA